MVRGTFVWILRSRTVIHATPHVNFDTRALCPEKEECHQHCGISCSNLCVHFRLLFRRERDCAGFPIYLL